MLTKATIPILISVLMQTLVFGQDKSTVKGSKFNFNIFGNLKKVEADGFLTINLVEIVDSKSNSIIQSIKLNTKFENPNNHELLEIFDINYDGNKDFVLLSGNGQYDDTIYDFYMFDVTAGNFKKWERKFNDGENMINVRPVFDETCKTITTYWHNTDTFQKKSVFEFRNGDYELAEEFNQELDKKTNNKYLITTYKKMIEGELRLVELEMISLQKKF